MTIRGRDPMATSPEIHPLDREPQRICLVLYQPSARLRQRKKPVGGSFPQLYLPFLTSLYEAHTVYFLCKNQHPGKMF